jgi:Xaa-Pro dipeptidase
VILNKQRALEVMDAHELDALVVTEPENVFYLSDYGPDTSFHFRNLSAAIFPRDDSAPATLIAMQYQLSHVTQRPSWMPNLLVQSADLPLLPDPETLSAGDAALARTYLETAEHALGNKQRLIARALKDAGLHKARLGFDDLRVMAELKESDIPDAVTCDAFNILREIRLVKTPEEIALLEHASRITQIALEGVAALVTVGTTAREMLHYFRSVMALHGGYGSHITGGGQDSPWIAYPDMSYAFRDGDIVYTDPAGHFRHYWADLGRSCFVGTPSTKAEELYAVLARCHAEVTPLLVPGTSTSAIKQAARDAVASRITQGFSPLTHSIGLEQYDHPKPLGDTVRVDFALEHGMVLNFETIYYEVGFGILQLEDTFHIQRGGPRRLGTLAPEPFLCPAR